MLILNNGLWERRRWETRSLRGASQFLPSSIYMSEWGGHPEAAFDLDFPRQMRSPGSALPFSPSIPRYKLLLDPVFLLGFSQFLSVPVFPFSSDGQKTKQ